MENNEEQKHNVIFDRAGWGNYPRLTCLTCDGKTLLNKPYMTVKTWLKEVQKFAKEHPSQAVDDYAADLEKSYGLLL